MRTISMGRVLTLLLLLAALCVSPAMATIMTFDFPAGTLAVPQGYGNRVGATTDAFGSYLEGNGFTPNVTLEFGQRIAGVESAVSLFPWTVGYGSLTNVAYSTNTLIGSNNFNFFRFTADPGFNVVLNSFDFANYLTAGIDTEFIVESDTGATFSASFSVPSGSSLTSTFSPAISGQTVTLLIQGNQFNGGLDNINFDQRWMGDDGSAIPEPSSALLLLAGALALAFRGRLLPLRNR